MVDADDSARTVDANWWRQAVVYQVYPRSFADANSDGVGDLKGVTSRVPYLASLGVDALWLSPFYPSALADGGYDVDDYRDVDARLGTLEDFDELLGVLSAAGLRLIVDIVPNHTSDRHAWFREALAAPRGSRARDRYIFRDGTAPNGAQPPSDWQSGFGGSMWTQVGDGQWYLHIHAREQPDLNWDHRDVRDDFLRTLRFWADRGVDGFRVDVAHLLAKHLVDPLPAAASLGTLAHGAHPFEDRDEVHEIYAEWRHVFNEYAPPRMAVAEAWVHASRRPRYASATGLGQAFNFDLLKANWDRDEFAEIIAHNLRQAEHSGASCTWVLSNHDVVRHATRYGLPQGTAGSSQDGRAWLLSRGQERRSTPSSASGAPGLPRCSCWRCLVPPICTRGRSSGSMRSPTCHPTSDRTRPSGGPGDGSRAATAAAFRCPGPSTGRPSASVPTVPTFPSLPGSVALRSGAGERSRLHAGVLPGRAARASAAARG